jgi:hypothetical protein
MDADLAAALLLVLVSVRGVQGTGLADVLAAVLDGAEDNLGAIPTREQVEEAARRLIRLGYAGGDGDDLVPTKTGQDVVRAARRVAPAARLQRIRQAILEGPESPDGSRSWELATETWDQARAEGAEMGRRTAADRLHIVEGLLRGIDLAEDIIRVSRASADADEIRRKLLAEPFGLSEIQANHVMGTPVRSFSEERRVGLLDEAQRLREQTVPSTAREAP